MTSWRATNVFISVRQAFFFGTIQKHIKIGNDDADVIRPVQPVNDGLLNKRYQTDFFFQRDGETEFSVFQFVLLFDAAGDVQKSVFIEPSAVAGAETAVGRHGGVSVFRPVVIAFHDIGAVNNDFAVFSPFLDNGLVNDDLDLVNGFADAAQTVVQEAFMVAAGDVSVRP